jgi:NAD(P)-dependent dehydrogenase (short-subunit alcohol dehydrogenase family)
VGKTVVISGGTDGMGRATALQRVARGDRVTVIGSDAAKGAALIAHGVHFLQADLSSVSEVERVVAEIGRRYDSVDALGLFANRLSAKRRVTEDGLEYTFALYYLSRYLLGHRLRPLMDASPAPVVINVAGVGTTKGRIWWDDPQLAGNYGQIRAQLQAGRANDLLGVAYRGKARYVLYHPGFTRSGSQGNLLVKTVIKVLAAVFARPVPESVRPIVDWIDHPPQAQLTAVDRDRTLGLDLPTLDPGDAARLDTCTAGLLTSVRRSA